MEYSNVIIQCVRSENISDLMMHSNRDIFKRISSFKCDRRVQASDKTRFTCFETLWHVCHHAIGDIEVFPN